MAYNIAVWKYLGLKIWQEGFLKVEATYEF